jgi:FlaA1/EpsC-like NDP-sugar epimerase
MSVRDEVTGDGDIPISITGLRPGEKLYEELLIGDNPLPTSHPRVMKGHEECPPWEELATQLAELEQCLEQGNLEEMIQVLCKLVPGYRPDRMAVAAQ